MHKSFLFCSNMLETSSKSVDELFSMDMLHDLNLDQIIEQVAISNHSEYITKIMKSPLACYKDIKYRQQIFSDLEDKELLNAVKDLSTCLERVEAQVRSLNKYVYEEQQDAVFLDIMRDYCDKIKNFKTALCLADLKSSALIDIKDFFEDYVTNGVFVLIDQVSQDIRCELTKVQYSMVIDGYQVKIIENNEQNDYNSKLLQVFRNFLPNDTIKGHCRLINNGINLNVVEYDILNCVKSLNPEVFQKMKKFKEDYITYKNQDIETFHQEIQFYIRYLDYIKPMKEKGIPFCYPKEVAHTQLSLIEDGCDLGLANKQCMNNKPIIFNNFGCNKEENVFVVTGPNQGGKTTYARMIGQIHYLFLLGVPVPARKAKLIRCNAIFTHFEHEEIAYNDYGKLQDDLMRMHDIFEHMSDHCLVIMNEMLSSTTYEDAVVIGEKIIEKLTRYDGISLYVTFVDRLASLRDKVVSLVSMIDTNEYDLRTYRIVRKDADGNVYATTLANKYDLSYDKITDRFAEKNMN